jgi:hypothetical protein
VSFDASRKRRCQQWNSRCVLFTGAVTPTDEIEVSARSLSSALDWTNTSCMSELESVPPTFGASETVGWLERSEMQRIRPWIGSDGSPELVGMTTRMMTRMKMRMRMMLTVSYAFLVAWSPWSLTPSRSSIPASLFAISHVARPKRFRRLLRP